MPLSTRLATKDDHAACAKVFLQSRIKAFDWVSPARFQLSDFELSVIGEEIWVAESDGFIVGFASIYIPDDFLHNLFIAPSFQGVGVGSLLLSCVLNRIQRPAFLKCLIANQKALKFYENRGWEKVEADDGELGPCWTLIKR